MVWAFWNLGAHPQWHSHFSKATPPQSVPPTRDQVFKHRSLLVHAHSDHRIVHGDKIMEFISIAPTTKAGYGRSAYDVIVCAADHCGVGLVVSELLCLSSTFGQWIPEESTQDTPALKKASSCFSPVLNACTVSNCTRLSRLWKTVRLLWGGSRAWTDAFWKCGNYLHKALMHQHLLPSSSLKAILRCGEETAAKSMPD